MNEIKPRLGIGDLLIIKMIYKNIKINKIIISKKLIYQYRENPEMYISFLKIFIKNLFDNPEIIYSDDNKNLTNIINYNFNDSYLYNNYKFNFSNINNYENYIVIHTKARFDYLSHHFNNVIKNKIFNYFKNFKSKYNILILGEKKIEQNKEAKIHNIISLYDCCMELINNNNVIDLTYDVLYSGNEYHNFEQDLFIINNSIYNIGFGYGGPLNISMAFSKNNIFYIDKLKHPALTTYEKINKNICRDINIFFNILDKNC